MKWYEKLFIASLLAYCVWFSYILAKAIIWVVELLTKLIMG